MYKEMFKNAFNVEFNSEIDEAKQNPMDEIIKMVKEVDRLNKRLQKEIKNGYPDDKYTMMETVKKINSLTSQIEMTGRDVGFYQKYGY